VKNYHDRITILYSRLYIVDKYTDKNFTKVNVTNTFLTRADEIMFTHDCELTVSMAQIISYKHKTYESYKKPKRVNKIIVSYQLGIISTNQIQASMLWVSHKYLYCKRNKVLDKQTFHTVKRHERVF